MDEFIKRLIARLKEEGFEYQRNNKFAKVIGIDLAIEIVNQLVEEYKDGWIPVSERLPNEEEMRSAYCRNHFASEFIVMIKGARLPTTLYRTRDGFWMDDNANQYQVIAWQPLPAPYKERDEG